VLPLDVVPVVRGGADYTELTPGRWFINAADYASPRHLATYLQHLIEQPEEFVKYLQGKEQYDIKAMFRIKHSPAWCDLCAKLNSDEPPIQKDLSLWWNRAQQCHDPTDINF